MLETFKTILQIFALFWVAVNNAYTVLHKLRRWLRMRWYKNNAKEQES